MDGLPREHNGAAGKKPGPGIVVLHEGRYYLRP